MVRAAALFIAAIAMLPLGAQQSANCCAVDQPSSSQMAPLAVAGKPVEMNGLVGEIHIVPGQGMPYFELKRGAETTRA